MRIALLCIAIAIRTALAQGGLDSLMTKKAVNCWDIAYNAGELMPKAYKSGAYDSLAAIATYWESKCGVTEPLWRFNLLQAIRAGNAPFADGDTTITGKMIYYKNRIESLREHPDSKARVNEYYEYAPPSDFDDMTYSLAESLDRDGKGLDRDDSLLVLFYQNKFPRFFDEVYSRRDGRVSRAFRAKVEAALDANKFTTGILFGAWIPLGNASLLGNHPQFGFWLGGEGRRFGLDCNITFKFMGSENRYLVRHEDSLFNTEHFFGGHISLDGFYVPHSLARGDWANPYFLAAIAMDGFDAIEEKKGKHDNKGIWAPALDLGLGNRFFYSQGAYLGLEFRYTFMDYDNEGGTDLSGHGVALNLKWGVVDNVPARNQLKNLGYTR